MCFDLFPQPSFSKAFLNIGSGKYTTYRTSNNFICGFESGLRKRINPKLSDYDFISDMHIRIPHIQSDGS